MQQPLSNQFSSQEWLEIAWSKDPPVISQDAAKVLENYSKIAPEEQVAHVTRIREKGFKIFPYPCIGQWRFLHFAIGRHPLYQTVLQRMLTDEHILLDLGCAFAQDIRRLVADGVDSSHCYGSDLRLEFLDLGYDLFRDKDTLQTKFIEADVFLDDSALSQLYGKVDIINASSFFHLFSWEAQKKVAHRCLKLWTGKEGDLLVGRHVGNAVPGVGKTRGTGTQVYRHNEESWRQLWDEITAETGVKFHADAMLTEHAGYMRNAGQIFGRAEETKLMIFSVKRIR